VPRVRRWHRVSHEFNQDREVQRLRRQFGDWMALVWLEMLRLADAGGGKIKGTATEIAASLSWVSLSQRPGWAQRRVQEALEHMGEWGWISVQLDSVLVCNYGEYRETRKTLKSPQTDRQSKDLRTEVEKPPTSVPTPIPIDLHISECLKSTQHMQSLANGNHGKFWKALEAAYDHYEWLYFEDEIRKADAWLVSKPKRRPTERGLPAFFRSWLERAIERGRKIHG